MLKLFYKSMNNKKGFTLIELIVVIAVLGILAAVALPRISGITGNARNAADAEQIRIMNEAVERYIAENGDPTWADTNAAITALTSGGAYLQPGTTATLPSGDEATFETDDYMFSDPDTSN